ncbi:FliG C-terminal domain-containing protein [Vibrio mediterranei]|uniref:FliG C-terminal domain-containing protein n=1 Tax=Vibrio mediterranei TaxID=689 RepID=UPI00406831E7
MDEQLKTEAEHARYYQSVDGVALMLIMMGPEVGAEILKSFSFDDVSRITRAMSKMEDVTVPEAKAGISGFFRDFQEHSGIVGGTRGYISELLENTLEGGLARNLVADIYGDDIGLKASRLEWIPADLLAQELQQEHVELQAMLFAHLKPKHSNEVLKHYDAELAHQVIYKVSQKEIITSSQVDTLIELIARIEESYLTTSSKTVDGVKATADILNRFDGNKSAFFEYVKEQDEQASEAIEEAMIDFFSLFRQSLETLEVVNETVTNEQWALALKGVDEDQKKYILNTMPSRLATQLNETMQRLGGVPMSKVELARVEILKAVRELNNEGAITLSFDSEAMVN